MTIHEPEISEEGEEVTISSRIDGWRSSRQRPDRLWFSLGREHRGSLTPAYEGFVAALLPHAMASGDDIELDGALDDRFAFGLEEYQRILHAWYPGTLRRIRVRRAACSASVPAGLSVTGTAFSGGVDSFHTLWSHLGDREPVPAFRITHALFLHGFDIPLVEHASYAVAADAFEEFLDSCGVRLVRMRTNARDFAAPPGWETAHGAVLTGAALQLHRLFGVFYIPSSRSHSTLEPWGSHPLLDHHLSTRNTLFLHDGGDRTRVDKILEIGAWEPTYRLLRTCYARIDGLKNCCRCDNCVRTMTILAAVGTLSTYQTFPLALRRGQIRRAWVTTAHERLCARQAMALARSRRRYDLALDQSIGLLKGRVAGAIAKRLRRSLLVHRFAVLLGRRKDAPHWPA